jgi:hypothetical protein
MVDVAVWLATVRAARMTEPLVSVEPRMATWLVPFTAPASPIPDWTTLGTTRSLVWLVNLGRRAEKVPGLTTVPVMLAVSGRGSVPPVTPGLVLVPTMLPVSTEATGAASTPPAMTVPVIAEVRTEAI